MRKVNGSGKAHNEHTLNLERLQTAYFPLSYSFLIKKSSGLTTSVKLIFAAQRLLYISEILHEILHGTISTAIFQTN